MEWFANHHTHKWSQWCGATRSFLGVLFQVELAPKRDRPKDVSHLNLAFFLLPIVWLVDHMQRLMSPGSSVDLDQKICCTCILDHVLETWSWHYASLSLQAYTHRHTHLHIQALAIPCHGCECVCILCSYCCGVLCSISWKSGYVLVHVGHGCIICYNWESK